VENRVATQRHLKPEERTDPHFRFAQSIEIKGPVRVIYVKHRGNTGGACRDLETFGAAITHHAKEGFHRGVVRVSLPPRGEARDRWLTRKEAAARSGIVGGIAKNKRSIRASRKAAR
jgi:hypothetical protein